MKMKLRVLAVLVLSWLMTGCGSRAQDLALQETHAASAHSAMAFATSYRTTLATADHWAKQTFRARREKADQKFVWWMTLQGYKASGTGKNRVIDPDPMIPFALIVPSMEERDEELATIDLDAVVWDQKRERISRAIDEYERVCHETYENEADAIKARIEHRQAIEDLLKSAASAAAAVGGAILTGGL